MQILSKYIQEGWSQNQAKCADAIKALQSVLFLYSLQDVLTIFVTTGSKTSRESETRDVGKGSNMLNFCQLLDKVVNFALS